MIAIIKKKLQAVRAEAQTAMMGNTPEAQKASGRFAACNALLNGLTPGLIQFGADILPAGWIQRQGWDEIINQFSGLIEEPELQEG